MAAIAGRLHVLAGQGIGRGVVVESLSGLPRPAVVTPAAGVAEGVRVEIFVTRPAPSLQTEPSTCGACTPDFARRALRDVLRLVTGPASGFRVPAGQLPAGPAVVEFFCRAVGPLDQVERSPAMLGVARGTVAARLATVKTASRADSIRDFDVTFETAIVQAAVSRAMALEAAPARVQTCVRRRERPGRDLRERSSRCRDDEQHRRNGTGPATGLGAERLSAGEAVHSIFTRATSRRAPRRRPRESAPRQAP
jgi:hypothetical protein